METPTERFMQRVAWWALAVLVLTGVHHAYGAAIYHTPWRLDVVFISALTAAAILGSLRAFRRRAADLSSRIAFWAFVAVVLAVPVAGIGAFEGGYNHALKNALYFSGASTTVMRRLFPPPAYELPDDVFFEFTGVLQLVLAVVTGRHLLRLVRERRRGQEVSTSEERIKQTVRRIFEDYVNRGESELLHVLFAEDYAGSQSGAPSTGRDGFAATMGALREGFPDIRYSLLDLIAEGDRVTARWKWQGTHRGVFRGPAGTFPPTGKSISNDGMGVFQLQDGKVKRASLISDRLGFLQEIGALPRQGVVPHVTGRQAVR